MIQKLQRILHIEDDPDIQEIVRLALEALGGYSVTTFDSGYEAIKYAPQSDAQLILLDVMMPRMDGIMTLSHLRKIPQTSDIPVIFITAKVYQDEISHYLSLGAAGVIAKPFDPMELVLKIEKNWAQYYGKSSS